MSEKTTNTPPKYRRSPALNASIILVFLSIVLLITLAMFVSFDEVTNRFEAGKVDIVLTEPHWKPKNGEETVPNAFIDKDPTIINKEDTVNTYVFLEVTIPYDDDKALIIDKPYQDYENDAGKVAYRNTTGEKVPYYKFIPTGETVDTESYAALTTDTGKISHYYSLDTSTASYYLYNSTQNVNSNWYLLDLGTDSNNVPKNPSINTTNKTFTYVYAYITADSANETTKKLEHLIPGGVVEVPLFNKIYVMNVRERAEVKNNNNEVTTTPFPDDSRDYSIHINAYGIQANFLENGNSTKTVPEEVWEMLKSGSTTTP